MLCSHRMLQQHQCGSAGRQQMRRPPHLAARPLTTRSRLFLHTRRASSSGKAPNNPNSSRESPTSSVSDAIVSFFDELTRGSVSIDEDDEDVNNTTTNNNTRTAAAAKAARAEAAAAAAAAAATAASAAAATARAAENSSVSVGELTKAAGEFEVAAVAAVVAALGSIDTTDDTSTSTSSSTRGTAAAAKQDANSGASAASKPPASWTSGSTSTSSSSRQAVTTEAVQAADGQLQKATLSLTAVAEDGAMGAGQVAGWAVKGVLGVGLLQAFKAGVEAAANQLNIVSIPPAVLSMLAVPLLLTALGSATADKVMRLFDSAVAPWTTDLLGLYFVPAVAVLPVLLRGMQGADLAGLLGVAAASTAATLLLTAKAAAAWTPQSAPAHGSSSSRSFSITDSPAAPVVLALSFLAAAGPLAATRFDPVNLGPAMALPVGFAWSVLGFVAARVCLRQQQEKGGKGVSSWLSPVLAGALAANVGVAWHGSIVGGGYLGALSRYYAGEAVGAGEVLTAPLGAALTALGFLIYKHRAALSLPAIAATSLLSAAFSVATSAAAARLLGVSTDWARALIPRSVIADCASHFARAIGAPIECTGLVVLLQAAFTIGIGGGVLRVLCGGGNNNNNNSQESAAAAAGTTLGATAGAMGVAGVCGSSGVALASGALSYACMVLIGGLASNVPAVTSLLAAAVA